MIRRLWRFRARMHLKALGDGRELGENPASRLFERAIQSTRQYVTTLLRRKVRKLLRPHRRETRLSEDDPVRIEAHPRERGSVMNLARS